MKEELRALGVHLGFILVGTLLALFLGTIGVLIGKYVKWLWSVL